MCYIKRVKKKHQKELKRTTKTIQGVISVSLKGTGYVKVIDQEEDIEIDFKDLHTALHGDTVEIALHGKGRGRITGEVSKIISRAKVGFAGVLDTEAIPPYHGGIASVSYFLKPDDTKMYTDILIPE